LEEGIGTNDESVRWERAGSTAFTICFNEHSGTKIQEIKNMGVRYRVVLTCDSSHSTREFMRK
jgi:hypothetical protein